MVNPDRNLYDPPYDDALLYDTEMEPERPRSRSLVVMLAFVVLAAFAGVVWVAYNQGVQQGQRGINPPLLSADAGPTRIEPDQSTVPVANPAPEKSYERLWASNGDRPAGQDNVTPGAEQPRNDTISEGTVPSTQEVATAAPPVTSAPAAPKQVNTWATEPARGGPLKDGPPVDPKMPNSVELTGEVGDGSTSGLGEVNLTQVPRETFARTPKAPKAASPVSAPATQVVDAAPAAPAEAPAASAGKVSIQLGSFPTDALAAAHWSKVFGANQAILGPYSPKFVSAEIPGKGTWFRLRVGGFADKSEAKAVCDKLIATGQACILAGK